MAVKNKGKKTKTERGTAIKADDKEIKINQRFYLSVGDVFGDNAQSKITSLSAHISYKDALEELDLEEGSSVIFEVKIKKIFTRETIKLKEVESYKIN
jgi:hypothetical protein